VQPLQGLYGSHPIYIDRRTSTTSPTLYHGVFLLNSNGMSVELVNGRLTYRLMGGVLDLYFLMGDSPNQVIFTDFYSGVSPPRSKEFGSCFERSALVNLRQYLCAFFLVIYFSFVWFTSYRALFFFPYSPSPVFFIFLFLFVF
jgi:hypothetical protein